MDKITATPAPKLANSKLYFASLVYAFVVTVVTVAILFDLDKMVEHPALDDKLGLLLLAVTVMANVLCLPYVLRLDASPLFRIVTFVLACIVPVLWLMLALRIGDSSNEIGLLGTHFSSAVSLYGLVTIGIFGAVFTVLALGAPRLKK